MTNSPYLADILVWLGAFIGSVLFVASVAVLTIWSSNALVWIFSLRRECEVCRDDGDRVPGLICGACGRRRSAK